MKILGIIGLQEITLLILLVIVGSYVYTINRAAKNIKRTSGSKRIKTLKWIYIVITVLLAFILFSIQIFGDFSIFIHVAGLGAIVGISKYQPSTLPQKSNKRKNDIENV